jgi:hypothetical protein
MPLLGATVSQPLLRRGTTWNMTEKLTCGQEFACKGGERGWRFFPVTLRRQRGGEGRGCGRRLGSSPQAIGRRWRSGSRTSRGDGRARPDQARKRKLRKGRRFRTTTSGRRGKVHWNLVHWNLARSGSPLEQVRRDQLRRQCQSGQHGACRRWMLRQHIQNSAGRREPPGAIAGRLPLARPSLAKCYRFWFS